MLSIPTKNKPTHLEFWKAAYLGNIFTGNGKTLSSTFAPKKMNFVAN